MDGETKPKVLIVDDEEKNLKLMAVHLTNFGYSHETARDGAEALEMARSFSPDIIFMDVMMPVMDGFEACRKIKEDLALRHIPVVMVTALSDRESRLKSLEAGASDFLSKPIDSTELMVRTKNLVRVKAYEDFLADFNQRLSAEVAAQTGQIKEGYLDTIVRLTLVAEYKDEHTAGHIHRVGEYCAHLAKAMGWDEERVETIRYAAPMHDIGKVGIPAEILLKPGPLGPEEFGLMKLHATIGGRILNGSVSHFLKMAEGIALTHHERWSGGGYPRGLRGEEIPLEGRLMNLADQYDALRSIRPYKPARSHEETVHIITVGDGRTLPGHFDPAVLEAFKDTHGGFLELYERMKD